MKEIESTLRFAKDNGRHILETESGLVYFGFQPGKMKTNPKDFFLQNLPKKYLVNSIKLPPISIKGNLKLPHLAPLFIMPINPDYIFALVFGFLDLLIYINVDTLIKNLEKEGCIIGGDKKDMMIVGNYSLMKTRLCK